MKLPNSGITTGKGNALRMMGIVLLLAGAVGLWLSTKNHPTSPEPQSVSPPANPSKTNQTPSTQTAMSRFLEIEAERRAWNETVWAVEWQAQRYEDTVVELWDLLRKVQQPLSVLRQFPVGDLMIGSAPSVHPLEYDVTVTSFSEPSIHWTTNDWSAFVQGYQAEGYELTQSEWRHPRFEPGTTNQPPRSLIAMKLHLQNTNRSENLYLEGNLKVEWNRLSQNPKELAMPIKIDATDLRMYRRQGPPFFEYVTGQEMQPNQSPGFIDPLIVHDLNGDGRSEIVFGSKNEVIWNQGDGQLKTGTLIENLSHYTQSMVIADFNQDGDLDVLCAFPEGVMLYPGDGSGRFAAPGLPSRFADQPLLNPMAMTAGDVDGDGDLDVWLAQYKVPYKEGQMPTPYYDANDGFPSFLLLNNGQGLFEDATLDSGLSEKRYRRTYSASLVDLDSDGDLDLWNVSDFAGVDVFMNRGNGTFVDVTKDYLDATHAFGMSHVFGDFNQDDRLDVLVIGMNSPVADRLSHLGLGPEHLPDHQRYRPEMAYGNRMYLGAGDRMNQAPFSGSVNHTGWSWGSTSADLDNDGDLDFYIVNGHKSHESVRDYDRQFWLHDIYSASSELDSAWDLYFQSAGRKLYGAGYSYGGFEKNRLLMRQSDGTYLELGPLTGMAIERDCRNVIAEDLDLDGKLDLVITTSTSWPRGRQAFRIYRNTFPMNHHWIGFQLVEEGSGYTPIGAVVKISVSGRKQWRTFVTGDSYRAQSSTTAHFGLGQSEVVDFVEVRWLNGQTKRWNKPEVDQYHRLTFRPQ